MDLITCECRWCGGVEAIPGTGPLTTADAIAHALDSSGPFDDSRLTHALALTLRAALGREPAVLACLRCGHRWTPRTGDVRICPKCKSARWDVPKEAR